MHKSLKGVYRNGGIVLQEIPNRVSEETPVIVTFLVSEKVDLRSRGITEEQAAYLRESLKPFAVDWENEEMDIYDDYDANKSKL